MRRGSCAYFGGAKVGVLRDCFGKARQSATIPGFNKLSKFFKIMQFEIIATTDGLSKQIFFVLTNRLSLNIDDFPHLKDDLYKISCSGPLFTLIFVEILQCVQSAFMENGI